MWLVRRNHFIKRKEDTGNEAAATAYKVIVYFAAQELKKIRRILRELGLEGHESIILIDATV
jgi:hypothetical protein